MDDPSGNQVMAEARARRRRLYELEETQRWVHHVADLNSGEVLTTPLDRPIAPLSRAERLSQLGHPLDPTVLGGPSYRLTPNQPYQASPEAWLTVSNGYDYITGDDAQVLWRGVAGQVSPGNASFGFMEPPTQRCLVSISLSALGFEPQGHLRVNATGIAPGIQVPVDATYAAHTVDLTFVPTDVTPMMVYLDLFERIDILAFKAISLGPAEPVFEG
jgi:hypothetical protein